MVLSVTKEEKVVIKHMASLEDMSIKDYLTRTVINIIGGINAIDKNTLKPLKPGQIILVKED